MRLYCGIAELLSKDRNTLDIETSIGYFTGLYMVGGKFSLPSLIVTALVVHMLDGVMCRLFARNNGYPKNLWMTLGFCFGIWAVAALLLFPKKREH